MVVPVVRSAESEEALVAAARLAAERGATVAVVTVLEVPLRFRGAQLPEAEDAAEELLDDAQALVESYGVRAVQADPCPEGRACDRRGGASSYAELVVVGAPRRAVGGRRRLSARRSTTSCASRRVGC